MKKIISQISLILIVMIIGTFTSFINTANAESIAGLNHPSSVNAGENFNVSLILPENAYAAEATITINFSDGKTRSKKLVYVKGSATYTNSVTISATIDVYNEELKTYFTREGAAGTATITATSIVISDSAGNAIENGGSKAGSLTVNGASTPAPSNPSSGNNGGNTATQANFKEVNETIYTTDTCNIRKSYSTSSEKLGKVSKDTALKRTGVGDNGWSRIEYNGQVAYITSQYVTTTAPAPKEVKFTDANDTMYAKQDCNVRKSWSTDSDKVGYLVAGKEVTRTGVGDNGWSRIKYNGQDYYVSTALLTNEKPEEKDENTANNALNNTLVNNMTAGNTVTNETAANKTELELVQEEIGVMPEVGNSIAVKIYIVITSITLMIVSSGLYFISKKREVK